MRLIALLQLAHLLRCNSETAPKYRSLSYQKFNDYQPLTDVRDHAVIDRDVALIESLLADGKTKDALNVYENGAYSRSYAVLHLTGNGLPGKVDANSHVTTTKQATTGTVLKAGKQGDKLISVLYQNSTSLGSCFVGGNPTPIVDGCFAESGQILFEGHPKFPVAYSYKTNSDNKNERSLAGFSVDANYKMRPCPHCEFYTDFFRFFQFYGKADYANQWVMSALQGTSTVFDSSKADFQSLPLDAKAAAVNKGLVVLNIVPFMIREMEEAAKECKTKCPKEGCSELGTRAVDAAAAYYFGSMEDGSGSGKLLYSIADLECKEFKTCSPTGNSIKGQARANFEILNHLQYMQHNVTNRACPEARAHKDQISKWIKVILIQGTLHYAYMRQQNPTSSVDAAIGAAYAASIVPFLSACSFTDAEIINNNMEVTARNTDFELVKSTFERQYTCLGVKCSDVGGFWDKSRGRYFEGAEMCSFDVVQDEKVSNRKKTSWGVLGAMLGVTVISILLYRRLRKTKKKTNKARESDIDFSDSSDDSYNDVRIT